jgi:hypothetical protein
MNRTLLCLIILSLSFFPLTTGRGQASGQGTKVHGFPMVSGTVWQTCGDWNDYDSNFKIAYLKGHAEATMQITQALSNIPSASTVKDVFEMPEGIRLGDYEKSLDAFCHDTRNVRVAIANAMGIVTADLAGWPGADEEILRRFRCIGAAGDNVAKINECLPGK